MEHLTPVCQSIVASYLELEDLTTFNLLDLLMEKDWQYIILDNYACMIDDTQSKGGFNTWKEFYYYLDRAVNGKATMLEFKSSELSRLTLKAVKDTIPFDELSKFFYPNIAATIASLKEGDVIKLKEEGDFLVIEKENTSLVLRYKTQYDPDNFGSRNIRIHDFSPIYDFPVKYWDKKGFEPFNLFTLSLRPGTEFKVVFKLVIMIYKNIRYMLSFKYTSSLDNFMKYEMPIRFRPGMYDNSSDLNPTAMYEAA